MQQPDRNERTSSLFESPRQALFFLREVEDGLLAALDWMPYASDVAEEKRPDLAMATEKHRAALDDVREARQSAEFVVLNEELS